MPSECLLHMVLCKSGRSGKYHRQRPWRNWQENRLNGEAVTDGNEMSIQLSDPQFLLGHSTGALGFTCLQSPH